MVQNGGREERRMARMGQKNHKKADPFITLECHVSNVVSENNLFHVLM